MKKKVFILFLFLLQVTFGQNPNREYQSHKQENGRFEVTTNDGTYLFTFYTPSVLETSFLPNGETIDENSHAVVLEPKSVETTYNYQGNVITYGSEGISVSITTSPFQISYTYKGKNITSEKEGYFKSKHIPMDMVKGNIVADETEKISFNLDTDEVLYGGGARALGMNRRGNRLPLYNRAHYGYQTYSKLLNFSMPIVISSKKYMIHFDNAPIGYLDFDSQKNNTLTYETILGRKTYQVIAGDNWYDILESYTELTGRQPMLPRWALGNFSSRFGYRTQAEVEHTIQKFKKDEIPVDAVILDLYWFGKTIQGTMGNLEIDRDSFPKLEAMMKDLDSKGVKTILITEPFLLTTSSKWKEAVSKKILATDSIGNPAKYDFYFGNTGIIDVFKKDGIDWFWNIYKGLREKGVQGIWGDLGEPEVLPSWVNFENSTADEVHNIYGHNWAKLIHEGYKQNYSDERPFILMRAGYSGSQRYGIIPWSGDVSRSWGGLQSQPEIALQMGMQGMGFMHSDLGGFAGANLDDNLYARWLQYGVFQPIYRPHAHEDVASEPVFRSPRAKALAKKAIELRYQLLPYNYHLVYENHTKGYPLMRPLMFEEEGKSTSEISATYMWGKDFLITPILKDSVKTKTVYFPKGSNWYDFYSGEKVTGGQSKEVQVKEEYIPTYVRGGAFITMTDVVQSTTAYDGNNLTVHYFYDESKKESEREVYNDNGKLAGAFEKGRFEILEFEAEKERKWLEIDFEAEFGSNWTPTQKNITLVIHNIDWNPRKIKHNGKTLKVEPINNQLTIPFDWNTKKETKIKVSLK
ncbi:MAG: glycosyl hydrolase [Flavobacteriaceae bacterium]|nr:glycosyl hydrolase [Flavobacteriaceae bacterium]|tara:strand:- start:47775 stop:50192 length:2418 start_codon:yes stop_codon:yes gene_type:complete